MARSNQSWRGHCLYGEEPSSLWEEAVSLSQLCYCHAPQDPRNTSGRCMRCGKEERSRGHLDPAQRWDLRAMIEETIVTEHIAGHAEEVSETSRRDGVFFQQCRLDMLLLADLRDLRALDKNLCLVEGLLTELLHC